MKMRYMKVSRAVRIRFPKKARQDNPEDNPYKNLFFQYSASTGA
jgi:hypothetical protein